MPERPHPDLSRVRDALRERDESVPDEPEETPEEPEPEDDGEA